MKKHLKRVAISLIGLLIIPLVAQAFDPYSPYDPYSGSYTPNFDFDNSVWTPSVPSGGSSDGSSGDSESSSGSGSSSSDTDTGSRTPGGCLKSLVPAGTEEVLKDAVTHAIRYFSNNEVIPNLVGRSGGAEIYMKKPGTDKPDYDHIIGKICFSSQTKSVGYIYLDKIEQSKKEQAEKQAKAAPEGFSNVKISKADNRVYYYTGPKNQEEIKDAMGNWSMNKIFQKGTWREVGGINYPAPDNPDWGFGWIFPEKIILESSTPDDKMTNDTRNISDDTVLTIPEDKTEAYADSSGYVYNAKTKERIHEAHYDLAAHKIYYVDKGQITDSTFGTMLTQTRGYVNLDLRGMKKPVTLSPEPYKSVETFKFKDVPEDQYYTKPVTEAAKKGWFKKKDRFEPAKAMTRCEFATVVIKALSIPLAEEEDYFADFKDVPKSHAAAPYVYTGVLKGYWKGQQDGSGQFACDKGLLRAEMAVVLVRVLGLEEESATYRPADSPPAWALPYIRKVHKAGLMKGLGDGKSWGAALTLSNADAITALFRVFGE